MDGVHTALLAEENHLVAGEPAVGVPLGMVAAVAVAPLHKRRNRADGRGHEKAEKGGRNHDGR